MSLNFLMPINLVFSGIYMANIDYVRLFQGHVVPILTFLTGVPHILDVLIVIYLQMYSDALSPGPMAKFISALFFVNDATTSVCLQTLYMVRLQAFFTRKRHNQLMRLFLIIPFLYVICSGVSNFPPETISGDSAFLIYAAGNVLLAINSLIMHIMLIVLLWQKCAERHIGGLRRLEILVPLFTGLFYVAMSSWAIGDSFSPNASIGFGGVALSWIFDMLALERIHVFMQRYIFKESISSNLNSHGDGTITGAGPHPIAKRRMSTLLEVQ